MKKNIWLPVALILVLWLAGLGGAYSVAAINNSSKFSVSPTLPPASTTPSTGIAVPPVTPGATTTVVLSGQAIFNANCLSCHRSRPPTSNLTQAQLSRFISSHHTGRNLTAEQVAAITALLKP